MKCHVCTPNELVVRVLEKAALILGDKPDPLDCPHERTVPIRWLNQYGVAGMMYICMRCDAEVEFVSFSGESERP